MSFRRLLGVLAICWLLVACATGGGLTRKDVLLHYNTIAQLDAGVVDARGRDAALLAPDAFERAERNLERAVGYARDARKVEAEAAAKEGLRMLEDVDASMVVARVEMQEVLNARQRVLDEGGEALLQKQLAEADRQLIKATQLLQDKNVDDARKQRPALMDRYAALELEAIKRGVMEGAEASIEQAENDAARQHAPRTLSEAKEELRLARAVLEGDRTRREAAEEHARRAIWLAGRASSISQMVKKFEAEDFELEDILLWHEAQLESVNEPLATPLPFDKSDRAAVVALRNSIRSLLRALDESRGTARKNEQEMAALQKKLNETVVDYEAKLAQLAEASGQQLAALKTQYESKITAEGRKQTEARLQREEAEQRFKRVETMFKPEEASVARTGENVRIDVYGFQFPSGTATITSDNFGLMDRIVSAVRTFPNSQVRVFGHTDSLGGAERNLRLSIERARAVLRFLVDVGGIEASRIESDGFGETKPVATNDTKEGRAKNRRVEIMIINTPASSGDASTPIAAQ